jgi:sulfite dehydrogenase (quinone) subunit SoeC
MHAAPSIIAFTTASGAGYGLLFLMGLGGALGLLPPDRWLGFVGLGLAFLLITGGLLSSLLHLGHPERAWRAISQWRSSWLSREGLLAILTYVPAVPFALAWVLLETTSGPVAALGLLTAVGAAATVYATSMIYACLKPIRHWHQPLVPPVYLGFALMTGAMLLAMLAAAFGLAHQLHAMLALLMLPLAWGLKVAYWKRVDDGTSMSTASSATGLSGPVRLLEPPHTEENYLQREMAFRIARRHAQRLRRIAIVLGLPAPAILLLVMLASTSPWIAAPAGLLASAAALAGVLVERWLFFAEAKHTATLYYGAETA